MATTRRLPVLRRGGDGTRTVDAAGGAVPAANLFSCTGNGTLAGGSGSDLPFQGGDGTLPGRAGRTSRSATRTMARRSVAMAGRSVAPVASG